MFSFVVLATIVISVGAAGVLTWPPRSRSVLRRVLVAILGFGAMLSFLWGSLLVLFVVALFEPWPLSRRQGPDTEYARACYARVLGQPPPASFTGIYCREEWGFGGDDIYSVRFTFADQSALPPLIERLGLEPVAPADRDRIRYLSAPTWFPTKANSSSLSECYHRSWRTFVWVDRSLRLAYFQRANF